MICSLSLCLPRSPSLSISLLSSLSLSLSLSFKVTHCRVQSTYSSQCSHAKLRAASRSRAQLAAVSTAMHGYALYRAFAHGLQQSLQSGKATLRDTSSGFINQSNAKSNNNLRFPFSLCSGDGKRRMSIAVACTALC